MDFSYERMAKKTLQLFSDDACRAKNKYVVFIRSQSILVMVKYIFRDIGVYSDVAKTKVN